MHLESSSCFRVAPRVALVVTAGVLAAGLLTACQAPAERAPFTGVYAPIQNYPRVTVAGELSQFIAIDQPVAEGGPPLKVTLPVRLLSDPGYESNIQYRFLFLNANNTPARGAGMHWTFLHLAPRDQAFLTGNALDSDAVDWRCEIRRAR